MVDVGLIEQQLQLKVSLLRNALPFQIYRGRVEFLSSPFAHSRISMWYPNHGPTSRGEIDDSKFVMIWGFHDFTWNHNPTPNFSLYPSFTVPICASLDFEGIVWLWDLPCALSDGPSPQRWRGELRRFQDASEEIQISIYNYFIIIFILQISQTYTGTICIYHNNLILNPVQIRMYLQLERMGQLNPIQSSKHPLKRITQPEMGTFGIVTD